MNVFSFLLRTPVYFCGSLTEMSDWGGMDAASFKKVLIIF